MGSRERLDGYRDHAARSGCCGLRRHVRHGGPTFSLCAIPDDREAVAGMARMLRLGAQLLLAVHVETSPWPVRTAQALIELVSVPVCGEHLRRRPTSRVQALPFTIEDHDRFALGIVERLTAREPSYVHSAGYEMRVPATSTMPRPHAAIWAAGR